MKTHLILNKINHKPILLINIFPFLDERPYIFPYLIDKDKLLKKGLKKSFVSLKKDNNIYEINIIIYKYITYRLLYETKYYEKDTNNALDDDNSKNDSLDDENDDEKYEWGFNDLILLFPDNEIVPVNKKIKKIERKNKKSLLNYIEEALIDKFNSKKKNQKININFQDLQPYLPKNKKLTNFIKDYLFNQETLVIPNYFLEDSSFLLNELYNYSKEVKNINKIKEIIFDNPLSNEIEIEENNNNSLEKEKIKQLNFDSLESIIFNDDYIEDDFQRFKIRYNLNQIFSNKVWCKLVIITPNDYKDIYELNEKKQKYLNEKLSKFENEDTNLKIIYLNFEDNSPFEKNFIYFCKNYLNNKHFTIVVIHSIGKKNFSSIEYDNLKKPILRFHSLKEIIYEKTNNDLMITNKDVKEFLNLFFKYGKFFKLNEEYTDNNILRYQENSSNINLNWNLENYYSFK